MQIESYRFGHLQIDGQSYSKDVLLLPPRVASPWWRKQGHRLELEDLGEVVAYAPEVLVVGTGAFGFMKVPEETRAALASRGIEVQAVTTKQACRVFTELLSAGRRAAAALHLTC